MTRRARGASGRLTAADVPRLAEFARGYLHEDMVAAYGHAAAAVDAYLADVSPEDVRGLADDLDRLQAAVAGWSNRRLETFFTRGLRAAWAPTSVADLERLRARIGLRERRR